ncbi:MAG: hypothetical protein ACLTR6_09820 [Clostridium fessum]
MLAALIVKNNMVSTPFMAFFLAVLKSGAMGMQQSTGVPKSLVDTITACVHYHSDHGDCVPVYKET